MRVFEQGLPGAPGLKGDSGDSGPQVRSFNLFNPHLFYNCTFKHIVVFCLMWLPLIWFAAGTERSSGPGRTTREIRQEGTSSFQTYLDRSFFSFIPFLIHLLSRLYWNIWIFHISILAMINAWVPKEKSLLSFKHGRVSNKSAASNNHLWVNSRSHVYVTLN